jgi:DNA polymerase-3 subunit delta'
MTVFGHDRPISAFLAAMQGDRLHHAWLFCGPAGVGKAMVAQELARQVLLRGAAASGAGADKTEHRNFAGRLIDAGTHPDLVFVERQPRDEKAIRDLPRKDWPDDLERARNITIDQIRALGHVFGLKPSLSRHRVVIVDAVDDLERGAANALLKNLEEPPVGTIFLMISHAPGRLLPTIRSRCRILRFETFDDDAMRVVLRRLRPSDDESEIEALVRCGQGSPGRALGYAGLDLAQIDVLLSQVARSGDASNRLRSTLAQSLSGKTAQRRYEAFLSRAPGFIADRARGLDGRALAKAIDAWSSARALGESATRQSLDPQMTIFAMLGHVASLAVEAGGAKA